MKTIGIIGTRSRNGLADYVLVEAAFKKIYEDGDTICSGKCSKGGDRFAVILHENYKTKKKWFPADWERHGKVAGFIRNTDIASESDVLIACVSKNRSGGTEDTIRKFKRFHPEGDIIIV